MRTEANPEPLTQDGSFFVPDHGRALLIRNGIPEQYCPPGHHALPPGGGKVEVRLLPPALVRGPVRAAPDFRALGLPYERSLLFVEGSLVGILRPSRYPEEGIQAWEGFQPAREAFFKQAMGPLKTCLVERLRTCLPAAGVCCGGRMAAAG